MRRQRAKPANTGFRTCRSACTTLRPSSANFATTTINGYTIQLNKTSSLTITLEVKGAVTSIEVSGSVAALDTTTAQLQTTFEAKDIADNAIASTGGNFSGVLNLSLLSAGVATSGGVGVGTGPSIGGQRPRNNDFMIEGVDNNNKGVTGPLVMVPNDAVAEFSLLENQFSPEFGHSSGGQFNTVVKSGTNSFHGVAYVYNQNRNYDAFDSLNGIGGLTSNPRFDNNRFGGQIGGPIKKNKLFFFVNYEQEPLGEAGTGGAVCSPTAAGLATINATPGLSATNVAIFEKYVAAGHHAELFLHADRLGRWHDNPDGGPRGFGAIVHQLSVRDDQHGLRHLVRRIRSAAATSITARSGSTTRRRCRRSSYPSRTSSTS